MPLPRSVIVAAGLGARGDLDLDVAVEQRRRAQRRAERRQRRRDVEHRDEVVAVADEARVRAHLHDDVEVARRPAAPRPRGRARTGGRAGRRRSPRARRPRACARATSRPRPVAARARRLRDAPVAVADVAVDGPHDLPERRARDRLQPARAAAALAGLDRRARLGAVAVAVLADVDRLEGSSSRVPRAASARSTRDLHRDVRPGHRAAGRPAAERLPPKNGSKRSEIEPKPSKLGPIPPERRPSCP